MRKIISILILIIFVSHINAQEPLRSTVLLDYNVNLVEKKVTIKNATNQNLYFSIGLDIPYTPDERRILYFKSIYLTPGSEKELLLMMEEAEKYSVKLYLTDKYNEDEQWISKNAIFRSQVDVSNGVQILIYPPQYTPLEIKMNNKDLKEK